MASTCRFIINIFIIFGFGIAFTVLMPGQAGQSEFEFGKPVYMALLALLGDFDLSQVDEYFASEPFSDRPSGLVMAVMLMLYVFLAAVVLVNLLIALMSARFERLSEQASEIWLFERMRLYREYKVQGMPGMSLLRFAYRSLVRVSVRIFLRLISCMMRRISGMQFHLR